MFFGRPYRKKKRALSLSGVPAPQAKRSRDMTWRPPVHNAAGIDRQFFEACFRCHAGCCGCGSFINHLNVLAARYGFTGGPAPPGGPGPRAQVRPALPAPEPDPQAENREPWRGAGGGNDGDGAAGNPGGAAGDAYDGEDLDALFAAVAEDAE